MEPQLRSSTVIYAEEKDIQEKWLIDNIIPVPPAVVMLVGEASAGKTTCSYAINKSLANIGFNTLYMDAETPPVVRARLMGMTGTDPRWYMMIDFMNTLANAGWRQDLVNHCRLQHITLLTIDPLSLLWPSKDENDNAFADMQVSMLKRMAQDGNMVVMFLWNMGQGGDAVPKKF